MSQTDSFVILKQYIKTRPYLVPSAPYPPQLHATHLTALNAYNGAVLVVAGVCFPAPIKQSSSFERVVGARHARREVEVERDGRRPAQAVADVEEVAA